MCGIHKCGQKHHRHPHFAAKKNIWSKLSRIWRLWWCTTVESRRKMKKMPSHMCFFSAKYHFYIINGGPGLPGDMMALVRGSHFRLRDMSWNRSSKFCREARVLTQPTGLISPCFVMTTKAMAFLFMLSICFQQNSLDTSESELHV